MAGSPESLERRTEQLVEKHNTWYARAKELLEQAGGLGRRVLMGLTEAMIESVFDPFQMVPAQTPAEMVYTKLPAVVGTAPSIARLVQRWVKHHWGKKEQGDIEP